MGNKIFLVFILVLLFSPKVILANVELSSDEIHNLMNSAVMDPLTWKSMSDLSPEDQAALILARRTVRTRVAHYAIIDLPKETMKTLIVRIGFLVSMSGQSLSTALEMADQELIKEAIKSIQVWMTEKEVKVATGVLDKYNYKSFNGNHEYPVFGYTIVYHPLANNEADVLIELYSPNPLEPPPSKKGIISPNNYWEIEEWQKLGKQTLDPFLIRIKGKVLEGIRGQYSWDESSYSVDVVYDENIPIITVPKKNLLVDILKSILSLPTSLLGAGVGPAIELTTNLNEISEPDLEGIEEIVNKTIEETQKVLESPSLSDFQDQIDDIAERIDLINQEIAKLIDKEEVVVNEPVIIEEEVINEPVVVEEEEEQEQPVVVTETQTHGSSGASPSPSYCSKQSEPLRNKVLINEVAWQGTMDSSNNEWIELKNLTNSDISLAGWQLQDKERQIKVIFNSNYSIGTFFLLERTSDDSVPGISADYTYSGALNDSNEALYLFDSNCELQDEITANPNWPNGKDSQKRSLERGKDMNWHLYSDSGIGTPRAENSEPSNLDPMIDISPDSLEFSILEHSSDSSSQMISINNGGGGTLNWTSSVEDDWLTITPDSGLAPSEVMVSINAGLDKGVYNSKIIITDSSNTAEVKVRLSVRNLDDNQAPLVVFDPVAPVYDSVPISITFEISDSSSGLLGFNLRWKKDDNDWTEEDYQTIEGAPIMYSGLYELTGDEGNYSIEVKAEDINGNQSDWASVSTSIALAKTIVINEVQVKNDEFVELYNYGDKDINLSTCYFSYYTAERDWNNPWRSKQFPSDAVIPSKGYYLIGLKGLDNPSPDWQPYSSNQLNDKEGAIAILQSNPEIEVAKIDALGWGNSIVKEGNASKIDKAVTRKQDSNDNLSDFEEKVPSPTNSKGEIYSLPSYSEAPWPMYLHDARHTSRTISILETDSPQEEVFVEGRFYPPVVDSSGIIYSEADKGLYAFYPYGDVKWFYETPISSFMPVISSEGIVIPNQNSLKVISFEGTLRWEKTYDDMSGIISVYDQTIYSLYSTGLLAINLSNGEITWKYDVSAMPRGEIAVYGAVYFSQGDNLYAVNTDGTLKWQKNFPTYDLEGSVNPDRKTIAGTPSISDDGTIVLMVSNEREWRAMTDEGIYTCLHFLDSDGNDLRESKCDKFFSLTNPSISKEGNIFFNGGYAPAGFWITTWYGFDSQGNDLPGWPVNLGTVGDSNNSLLSIDDKGIVYGITGNTLRAYEQTGIEKFSVGISKRLKIMSFSGDGIIITGNNSLNILK